MCCEHTVRQLAGLRRFRTIRTMHTELILDLPPRRSCAKSTALHAVRCRGALLLMQLFAAAYTKHEQQLTINAGIWSAAGRR
jgi:hypothetical protein